MSSKTTNPLMNKKSKEDNNMEMLIGVILPIVLIVIANKLQADYKSNREAKMYQANVNRFAEDVMKQIKMLSAPKD